MENTETLGLAEVAALLRAESETVMQYARRGELPGTRLGKSWVFMREDVLGFLRKQITADTEARQRVTGASGVLAVHTEIKTSGRRKKPPTLPTLP